MNDQEIFDIVKSHLLTQKKAAQIPGGNRCQYRLGELKCAVGVLIPDTEYVPEMEFASMSSLTDIDFPGRTEETKKAVKLLTKVFDKINISPKSYRLLKALQDIHDYSSPHYWENELIYLAKKFDLR